jgi:hypothetical protein
MNHKCKICNKYYSSSQSLCNHNRKFHNIKSVSDNTLDNTLDDTLNTKKYNCNYCNKQFKHFQNRWKHENICKTKNNITIPNEILVLKNEIDNLKNEIKKKATTNNNFNNTNINNGNIININSFSNDNIEHISEEFIKKMFSHFLCEDEHNLPIPKLLENIKFNSHHLENNNVKITNMRSDVALKFDNEKWMTVDKEELLNEMFKIGANLFLKFYKDKKGILSEDMQACYKEFQVACYSNDDLTDDIKERIQKVAYIYTKNIQLDK